MGHILLSELSPHDRKQVCGRSAPLPTAKGASAPYYYDGQLPAPLPDGTPISVWSIRPGATQVVPYVGYGYWIARTSSPTTWSEPCVFRTRRGVEMRAPKQEDPDKDLRQGAAALLRAAKALERLCEVGERIDTTLCALDSRISYLAGQIELCRRDNKP